MTERLIISHSQKAKNDLVAVRRELVIDKEYKFGGSVTTIYLILEI